MPIHFLSFFNNDTSTARALCNWLLLLIIVIPLSCAAQKNNLSRISSVERSDNQGHVIRFQLRQAPTSFDFSQPSSRIIQFQVKGHGINAKNIIIDDRSGVIEDVDFYDLPGGMGVDIFLENDIFYEADAYPDRNGKDVLLALTKTTQEKLAQATLDMKPFAWSNAKLPGITSDKKSVGIERAEIDTSYQKIKDKIKFDTVVLDAGHGGEDVGTHHNGVYEKNVVLSIAKKVGGYIKEHLPDVNVVYTRKDDRLIDLYERGPIANRAEGDLFVSIHANAVPSAPSAHGTETYFLGLERSKTALQVMERENTVINPDGDRQKKELTQEDLIIYELANSGYIENSQKLAAMIEQQFRNRANRKSRGVKQARFVVLYQASMPAILVETGFISNPSEAKYLTSDYGQNIIASAIFRAIRDYKEQFEKSQHFNTN